MDRPLKNTMGVEPFCVVLYGDLSAEQDVWEAAKRISFPEDQGLTWDIRRDEMGGVVHIAAAEQQWRARYEKQMSAAWGELKEEEEPDETTPPRGKLPAPRDVGTPGFRPQRDRKNDPDMTRMWSARLSRIELWTAIEN